MNDTSSHSALREWRGHMATPARAARLLSAAVILQVHRPHWIATNHVTSADHKGDGATLRMSDGTDIPVSRANVPALREVGFLPR